MYLGKNVVCQHCGAEFEACDPNSAAYPPSESSLSLLARVDELIETAARSGIGVSDSATAGS